MTPRDDPAAEIDRLFQRPLSEFTAARNDLAASLRAAGQPAEAATVRALAKPSVSAWAVNQLRWRTRPVFDALIEAGERVRAAQRDRLRGRWSDAHEAAGRTERDAVGRALAAACRVLADAGQPPSAAVRQRIGRTLEALASFGRTRPELIAGRLVADVEPPGFEGVRALAPLAAPARRLSLVPPRAERTAPAVEPERDRAEYRLAEAERRLKACRRDWERVDAARANARLEADAARGRVADRRQEYERAQARLAEAEAALDVTATQRTAVRAALRDAEREARHARAALDRETRRPRRSSAAGARPERPARPRTRR